MLSKSEVWDTNSSPQGGISDSAPKFPSSFCLSVSQFRL